MMRSVDGEDTVYSIRVACRNNKGFYRIKTIWNDDQIKLTLLDSTFAFFSNISKSHLTEQATKLTISYDEFIKRIQSSLSEDENTEFAYERKDYVFFIYQKHTNISVQLMNFPLEETNYIGAVEKFIDTLRFMAYTYKTKLENFEEELNIVKDEKTKTQEKLEKFIQLKEDEEHDLYGKFVLVLNENKKRIQYMKEVIDSHAPGNKLQIDKICDISVDKLPNKNVSRPIETISDSDSEDGFHQVMHEVQIEPSTSSKRKFEFHEDEMPSKINLPKRGAPKTTTEDTNLCNETTPERMQNNRVINDEISVVTSPKNSSSDNTQNYFSTDILSNMLGDQKSEKNPHERDLPESEVFEFSTQDLMDRL